jgi:hypothetical protein
MRFEKGKRVWRKISPFEVRFKSQRFERKAGVKMKGAKWAI